MATTERHNYTAAYLRILTVCLLIFFATFIFGRDHSTEIPVDVKTTKDTPLTVERWLQQQNQRKLKDNFAKAGIHPYVICKWCDNLADTNFYGFCTLVFVKEKKQSFETRTVGSA